MSLARRLSMTHVGIHEWVQLTLLSSGAPSEFAGASPALPFTITTQVVTALAPAPSCLRISWLDVASAGLLCTHRYITLHVASHSPRDGAFEAQARLSRRRCHIFPSHDSSASCVMYVCVCVRAGADSQFLRGARLTPYAAPLDLRGQVVAAPTTGVGSFLYKWSYICIHGSAGVL